MSELKLSRPIAFFDIESTGVYPMRDRIVELSVLKLFPDGSRQSTTRRLNPGIPIPAGATAIHGISDADVADCPVFSDIAPKLFRYLSDCDFAGYNVLSYDLPLLQQEFKRAGLEFSVAESQVVDVFNIFCKLFPRNLSAAYKFFCGKDLEGAHGAAADTAATLEVLLGQMKMYPEMPETVPELALFGYQPDPDALDRDRRFRWCNGEAVINFGKHSGRTLRDIAENEPGFLRWIDRSDFSEEVKTIARDALAGKFPARDAETKND